MKKSSVKLTDIILFTIAGIIDLFEEMKDPGNLFSNYYQNFYGFVPANWRKQNLVWMLSKCHKKNLIIKTKKGKKTYLDLTPSGKIYLYKKFPHLFWNRAHWDGQWRFIFFDIKEIERAKRDFLRLNLKQAGFLMIQKSVWCTPSLKSFLSIKHWLEKNKIFEKILLIETNKILSRYEKKLVNKFWSLGEVNNQLKIVLANLKKIESQLDEKEFSKLKKEFDQLYSQLITISLNLPTLPKRFYPRDWRYSSTWRLAKKLKKFFIKKVKN